MRRDVELWIGSQRADLSDDSFVLMTYTMEDLASPAIVRNSFSKQITLPGTTANNRIFGEIFRNDRQTQYHATNETGINFDPTRKTSWRLYNGRSEVLDSGYLRLDSVKRRRNVVVEYKVTLYGGLGQFLYALAYNDNGEKRRLADLDFRGTSTPSTEFNFTLNAAAVRAAWMQIASASGTPSNVWDFINFAPCYNGKPTGTFDAKKGLLDVVSTGIAQSGTGTVGGLALVTLAQEYTEWQTKDLRSYLQRPVVRLRSIIEAACASRNNGGWTVALDPAFFADTNPYWQKSWMTLPIIDTENSLTEDSGGGSLVFSPVSGNESVMEATLTYGGVSSRNYRIAVQLSPEIQLPGLVYGDEYMHCEQDGTVWMNYVTYTLTAYNTGGQVVDEAVIRISSRQPDASQTAPQMTAVDKFISAGSIAVWDGDTFVVPLAGNGISRVRVTAATTALKWGEQSSENPSSLAVWTDPADYTTLLTAMHYTGDFGGSTYAYGDISGGRSGKAVTKAMLLSGGGTPADYLLSLCKTFGLVMVVDGATKTVSIEKRSTFYQNEVVDISDRIDMDTGYDKAPFYFDAKWYVWAAHYDRGEWAKIYAEKYGATFAQMRVDTGFAFDSNTVQVMDSAIFHGAVMALENSKYYSKVSENGVELPSVLLDRGAKYTISPTVVESRDVDINLPTDSAVVLWMNSVYPSYDIMPKPQFHDKDNAPFDERDTLLLFDGMEEFQEGSATVQLPWDDMTHPSNKRSAKYIGVKVKAGDVITVKLTDYTTWRFGALVLTEGTWGHGTVISDTGWLQQDLTKTISAAEDGNWFRITIAKANDGNFSAADGVAALAEATAVGVRPTAGNPYVLTDDTTEMLTLNNGTPCWLLQWAQREPAKVAPDLPRFSRYMLAASQGQGYTYDRTLDFGTPVEVPIPGVSFAGGATIWSDYFDKYIADRYDDDSAVVRCKVNLAGMKVGPDLMRRFYWFDGAVWALNKIINHSMTTWDLTECEFVKVQDIANYTT